MITLARAVDGVLSFYAMLILAYVIISWFRPTGFLFEVFRVIGSVVEPYISVFRRFMPNTGAIDFSPLAAILVLQVSDTSASALVARAACSPLIRREDGSTMKLTPLDIHHKEFHHALRGYSEEEVDTFLDEVADEFERLFKENIDLSEKLEATSAKVRDYQSMEVTLNNTMVSAQRSAEQIVAQANEEASAMLRDAEVKAKEIIHAALTDKQKAQGELIRIKQAEEDFRGRFRTLLEKNLAGIKEVELPQDVTVMIGETHNGPVSGVALGMSTQDAGDLESGAEALTAPAAAASPAEGDAQASQGSADARADVAAAEAAGVVESMTFGELEGPDLIDETLGEPREFETPSLDAFGERDDDLDIEEID